MNKKYILLLLIICITIAFSGCEQGATQDNQQNEYPSAMELIEKSSEYYKNIENFEMKQNMVMTMIMPNMMTGEDEAIKVNMDSTSIIFIDPMKSKTTMFMDYTFEDSSEENVNNKQQLEPVNMEQYMIQENDSFIIYQYNMGQWYKTVINNPEIAMQQIQGFDYLKDYQKYFKSGEILGIETINGVEAYKAQFQLNSDYITELLEQYGFYENLELNSEDTEIMNKIFASLEDVVYEIWISKEDYSTLKLSADITPMFTAVKNVMLEQETIPEEEKNEIENTLGSMTGVTEIYYTNVNNCEDFEIPQEALNAVELPQY